MKGAIAEPLVSTIRPPKMTIIMKMGISQYFFRARRNDQNSRRNDSMRLKIGSSWIRAVGPGGDPVDPIARGIGITAQSQRVLAQHAHQQRNRRHRQVEQESRVRPG